MAIEVTHVRKAVSLKLSDPSVVKGKWATVLAAEVVAGNPSGSGVGHGEVLEKKTVPNKGHFSLAFPLWFAGEVFVQVVGSAGGEDHDVVLIPGPPDDSEFDDE